MNLCDQGHLLQEHEGIVLPCAIPTCPHAPSESTYRHRRADGRTFTFKHFWYTESATTGWFYFWRRVE